MVMRDGHLKFEVTRCMFVACLLCQQEALHWLWYLGPLHTQAKSHDHEIVRAQKKVFKCRSMTPPKSCSVVTDPQV